MIFASLSKKSSFEISPTARLALSEWVRTLVIRHRIDLDLGAITLVGFLLFTPYALFSLNTFLRDAGEAIYEYRLGIGTPFAGGPGWPVVVNYLRWLSGGSGLGLPFFIILAVGILLGLRYRFGATIACLAYPALLLFIMAQSKAGDLRNLVPATPFFALLIASSIDLMADASKAMTAKMATPRRMSNILGSFAWIALATGLVGATVPLVQNTVEILRWNDTRNQALTWVSQHVPPGTTIAVQDAVHIQPSALAKLPYKFVTIPTTDLSQANETGATYLITTYATEIWNEVPTPLLSSFQSEENYLAVACFQNHSPITRITWLSDETDMAFAQSRGAALDSVIVSPPVQVRQVVGAPAKTVDCESADPFPLLMRNLLEDNPQSSDFNARPFNIDQQHRMALVEQPPGDVSASINLPRDPILTGAVALSPHGSGTPAGDNIHFIIDVTGTSGERIRALDILRNPKQSSDVGRWKSFSVNLAEFSEQTVTISLRTETKNSGSSDAVG